MFCLASAILLISHCRVAVMIHLYLLCNIKWWGGVVPTLWLSAGEVIKLLD